MKRYAIKSRRGVALIYITITLVALLGFCSLAVDLGRVQVVKTELRRAADAAARAAVGGVPSSVTQAQQNAIYYASCNLADGSPVVLDSASDIEFGIWNTSDRTFTVLSDAQRSSANALRITARRTAARGNAVPLLFAGFIGRPTCDVQAQSIAHSPPASDPSGFIGLGSITFKNNAFVASYSYDSTLFVDPSHSHYNTNGGLGSNGAITGGQNNVVYGTVMLGPVATFSGVTVTGATHRLTSNLPTPVLPAWSPSANPNSLSQNYTSTGTTLPGGSYWFTSLNIPKNKPLTFNGPTTLHVNGNILIDDLLAATSYRPADLTIYQYGNNTFLDDKNHMDVVAVVIAPGVTFITKNNATLRGSVKFGSMEFKNNADLYYDESLGSASGLAAIKTVR